MSTSFHLVVPGPLESRTGGYIYDRHVVEAARASGAVVEVHVIAQALPATGSRGDEALDRCLASLPTGADVVIDGLAGGGHPEPLLHHAERLRLVALVHHPLAMETGLRPSEQGRLLESERRSLRAVRGILCTSEPTAEHLTGDYGVGRDRIAIVRPGVVRPRPCSRRSDGDIVRLLCVATLTPRKGHRVLLDALAQVEGGDRWELDCVGNETYDPATTRELQARVEALGWSARVRFHGELDECALERCWERTDLFVLASHYEGYGMAVDESLARGIPVVVTRAGAAADRVPSRAGCVVAPGDVPALATALARFLGDPERRGRLRRGAQAAAGSIRTWDQVGREFLASLAALR